MLKIVVDELKCLRTPSLERIYQDACEGAGSSANTAAESLCGTANLELAGAKARNLVMSLVTFQSACKRLVPSSMTSTYCFINDVHLLGGDSGL